MGNRPSSTIIYGFTYQPDDSNEDEDVMPDEDDIESRWESHVYALCDVPENRPTDIDWATWRTAQTIALRTHGQRIDWDAPEVVDLTLPTDVETKLRALCEFYGVPYSEPRMLLLSSYG
jgi:hypothetical protein